LKAAEVIGEMNRIITMRQESWRRLKIRIIMGVLMIGFYLHHAQNLNLTGEEKKVFVSPVEKCPLNFTTGSRETYHKSKMSRDEKERTFCPREKYSTLIRYTPMILMDKIHNSFTSF
jgi:hypothetical protein